MVIYVRFFIYKNVVKIKKNVKNVKSVTRIKNVKKRFLHLWLEVVNQCKLPVRISYIGRGEGWRRVENSPS